MKNASTIHPSDLRSLKSFGQDYSEARKHLLYRGTENILRGEMSLVGPRPELAAIVAEYKEWQRLRLEVKPGLTGLWQIMGRKDLFLHQNLEYDFYYIKNRSLLLDFSILARTIPAMLFGASPAYRGWLANADVERQDFSNLEIKKESKETYQAGARA